MFQVGAVNAEPGLGKRDRQPDVAEPDDPVGQGGPF